ncbi:MAG: hypothetical protein IPK77_15965 [Cellvibrio sp.]|nr:hypothetical protein [Cellvibrio sp.]
MLHQYDLDTLESSLKSLDGFEEIMKPFMFFFGRPKAGFDIWSASLVRKALINYKLADYQLRERNGTQFYQVCAFSTKGELSSEYLAQLRHQVRQFSLEVVRRESNGFSLLSHFKQFLFDTPEELSIIKLSDPKAGIFVFPIATGNKFINYPVVLYSFAAGAHKYFPVNAKDIGLYLAADATAVVGQEWSV